MSDTGCPFPRSNWTDAGAYRALLQLDRAGWAWEFLRRHPDCGSLLEARAEHRQLRAAPPLDLLTLKTEAGAALRWGLRFRGRAGPSRAYEPRLLAR